MYPRPRWTSEKIKQRLELITPLVYRKQKALPSFRHRELAGPLVPLSLGVDLDDFGWQEISVMNIGLGECKTRLFFDFFWHINCT
jgi:alpha-mannosidase